MMRVSNATNHTRMSAQGRLSLWKRDIQCLMRGHSTTVVQRFSVGSTREWCVHCGRSYAVLDIHTRVSAVEWDTELHKLYEEAGHEVEYASFEQRLNVRFERL
jgi:hypothetical protein